jgi:hypothetical protein
VVKDATRRGQHDVPELPGWQELRLPFLEVAEGNIEPWADRHAFIEPTKQIQDNFAAPVIVNNLEFTDVPARLHHFQKLDDDLTARADEHLSLAAALGICDRLQRIRENGRSDHGSVTGHNRPLFTKIVNL